MDLDSLIHDQSGYWMLRELDSGSTLGIEGIKGAPTGGINRAVCLFKREPDALEYVYAWEELDPDEFEPYGSEDPFEVLDLLKDLRPEFNYVALNPPLIMRRGFFVLMLDPFLSVYEEFLNRYHYGS